MEECTIKYGDSGKEISENTKKIIALVESEDFLETNECMMSDMRFLWEIVYSARADVHYKRELLNGIMEEFQNTDKWNIYFMEYYEPFCMAVDFMEAADGVSFTLTKVTRDKNNALHHDNNFLVFLSVDEISRYIEARFDAQKDSEDDREWYIAKRHENIKKPSFDDRYIEFSITVVKSEISNDKQKQSVDALISILYIEFGKGNQKLLYIRNRL